jgi:hypothetical protein
MPVVEEMKTRTDIEKTKEKERERARERERERERGRESYCEGQIDTKTYPLVWLEQDADPLPETVPLAHAVHAVALPGAYVLAGHDEHDVAPDDDMVPAAHTLLTAGVAQYEPAGHVTEAAAMAGQNVPALHGTATEVQLSPTQ